MARDRGGEGLAAEGRLPLEVAVRAVTTIRATVVSGRSIRSSRASLFQRAAFGAPALLPFPGTNGADRYVGSMITTHVRWRPDRHLEFNFEYTAFQAGRSVTMAGGRDADLLMVSGAYRF